MWHVTGPCVRFLCSSSGAGALRPWKQHPKLGGYLSTAGKLISMSAGGSDHCVKLKTLP